MEDGPPSFPRGSTCPAVLRVSPRRIKVLHTGLSPSMEDLSRSFCYLFASLAGTLQPPVQKHRVWALPRSLAATNGISFDFFSSGYLDVSVPRVRLRPKSDDLVLPRPGFPIRTPPDQSLFSGSPKIFAAYRVLHRLLAPRHPPFALSSLTNLFNQKDNRSKPGKT